MDGNNKMLSEHRFFTEKNFAILLLAGIGCLLFFLARASENNEGGADAFEHYFMSRYAFKYPSKFLDLWGKPVFTMLSSPFSQLGIVGTKTYNILAALVSAFTCYLIAKKLQLRFPLLVIVFLCFAPMYFIVSISALTEITFGLVIILAVYFMMDEKYNAGAGIISFLPFARQEGVFIIFIFLAYLVWKRKFTAIPFLTFGFLFFSMAGYHLYQNFWWIIKEENFKSNSSVYGHGDLFQFLNHYEVIIGKMLGVLFILGLLFILKKIISARKKPVAFLTEEILLIYGVLIAFVIGHSYVWWQGTNGSLGLTRVMAGGLPLASIICLNGFNFILPLINWSHFMKLTAITFMLFLIMICPFQVHNIPIPFYEEGRLMKDACAWIKKSEYGEKAVCYYDPLVCFFLDRDKFDRKVAIDQIPNIEHPEVDLPNDIVVVWDGHFGPNEGSMPLERLVSNPHFRLLKEFKPETPFKSLNGYDYSICIFLHADSAALATVRP